MGDDVHQDKAVPGVADVDSRVLSEQREHG